MLSGQVLVGNLSETAVPWAKYHQRLVLDKLSHRQARRAQHKRQSENGASEGRPAVATKIEYEQPEYEAKLEPYIEWKYSFDDYSEMVLQYGYVVLFVSAMPLAPLLALFNNALEMHIDAYKLVCLHRRPWPNAAMSIEDAD